MDTADPHLPNTAEADATEAPAADGRTDAAQPQGAPADAAAAGRDPPQVIRGESQWIGYDHDTGERAFAVPVVRRGVVREFKLIPLPYLETHPYAAITDWLNFTFPMAPFRGALGALFPLLFDGLGPKFAPAEERRSGMHLYHRSFKLGETGARFAFGGNNDTGLLSLTGEACSVIPDWPKLVEVGRDRLTGRISRWDGAVDDYLGIHTVDQALQLYLEGKFGTEGRRPSMKQFGNWACPDGSGRSIAMGKREHGKRLEVYEKGMELGAKWHPWVRWEVCIGNASRIIPWDVLLEPGRYVVGAYPKALAWIQKEASRIATIQKQTQLGYDALVHHAARQYGALVRLMREVEGSDDKVLDKLEREGTPKRLKHPAIERPEEWLE